MATMFSFNGHTLDKASSWLCLNSTVYLLVSINDCYFRSITAIRITQMFVDVAHVSGITRNGQNDFKTNLYFKDSKSGIDKICMIAEDSNGYVHFVLLCLVC